ncbi:MAG TPA: hypothetical protein VGH43_18780 [Jatrophihabitans sp.]|jgi:predicted nucleic acid-binding protein
MTTCWFPDNTVLCNFAAVDRLPLLSAVLDGRGRWVEAVAAEAEASAAYYPELRKVAADGWMGEPIQIAELRDIELVESQRRAALGGRSDEPKKHLGEAQTCFVITEWAEFAGSWWITDDQDALDYAHFKGITSRETADLIGEAIACAFVTRADGYAILQRMVAAGRHLRVPAHASHL